ncbi:J domain-containing protein [Arthrobacter rhombi]|uniref:J domain-containing protein n=1 Tax=Arthrobacter rhombi TaxID=71253 RepID=UPI003F8FB20B
MSFQNHYEVLGVADQAPLHVIKATHRAWMKEVHPDSGANGDVAMAASVNEAFRVLSNPQERADFDRALARMRSQNDAENSKADSPTEPEREPDVGWGQEQDVSPTTRQKTPDAKSAVPDFANEDPSRLAGYNVFDRESIDLNSMEWFRKEYSGPKKPAPGITWPKIFKRSQRFFAWLAFSMLSLLYIIPALISAFETSRSDNWVTDVLIFVAVLPAITLFFGYARARHHLGLVRYIIGLLLGAAATWYIAYSEPGPGWLMPAAWLVLFILTVELFHASSSRRNLKASQMLPTKDFKVFDTWGNPDGGTAAAHGHNNQRNISAVALSKIMTGQLMGTLIKIPGTKIIHGLGSPGGATSDVIQAVLCGNRLALVDSKNWPRGDYYWLGHSLLHARPHEQPQMVATSFPTTVATYQHHFPKLEVRGWYILHSRDGGVIRTNNRQAGDKPALHTPEPFLRDIGNWLSEGAVVKTDRRQLSRLLFTFMAPTGN